MKFCASHWDMLRTAIDDNGLGHLVSGSGKEAGHKLEGQLSGEPEAETFDPLMNANFGIWNNAIKAGGPYLIFGDYCPICESETHGGQPAEWWITNAVNDQVERAKELGLLRPVN